MAKNGAKELDIELIKKHLEYNSETGVIVWLEPTHSRIKRGDIAGTIESNGYRVITLKGQKYKAQRIAWALHHGVDPGDNELDHKDRDKCNNAISNLRLATRGENSDNKVSRGIYKHAGKWKAQIRHRGVDIHIGYYECPLLGHVAYVDKARELKGEFAAV